MADYEVEDEVLIKTEPEDYDYPVVCVIQKVFCNQKILTTRSDIKFSIQDVRSRIRFAILSLTMGAAKISCQKRS